VTIRMETLRAKLEPVNLLFTRHVYMDKVNFLFTQWTNLPDSVNLRETRDDGHVVGLSTVTECFFVIKPTRCTNFRNLFWHETLHVSDSSSVHHQEFIHYKLSNGICHTGL
jgi:hypothetical protein